jgi:hypothetical protein
MKRGQTAVEKIVERIPQPGRPQRLRHKPDPAGIRSVRRQGFRGDHEGEIDFLTAGKPHQAGGAAIGHNLVADHGSEPTRAQKLLSFKASVDDVLGHHSLRVVEGAVDRQDS